MIDRDPSLRVAVVKAVRAPFMARRIREVLEVALRHPEVAERARLLAGEAAVCELTVRITGDRELRRLNREYAGEDSVTDVLSFEGSGGHVGDLAISWSTAVRQAEAFGHEPETELALLCVHGLLHLLGWDHATAGERKEMNRITRAALKRSGITLARGRL